MRPLTERGLTLAEILVSTGVFALLLVVLTASVVQGEQAWRDTSAATRAERSLKRAVEAVREELAMTSFAQIRTRPVPGSLAGTYDGDAVWFLSAVDPASGRFQRKADGSPRWMRNILYYLVVPQNHAALYGYTCTGGPGADGYDDRCPHKALVRKVIDAGAATTTDDSTPEEVLLTSAEVAGYLTAPSGLDVSGMIGEPGLENARLLAHELLGFRVFLAPEPSDFPTEVQVDVRGVAVASAEHLVGVGTRSLSEGRFTLGYGFSVFPSN